MKKHMAAIVLALLVAALAPCAAAQAKSAAAVRAETVMHLQFTENRLTALAEAIPQEKFTWRPGEGVRSVSEVLLHVVIANYSLPRFMGTNLPEGWSAQGFERSTSDKAQVISHLKKSFEHARNAVQGMADADVSKATRLFGRDTTHAGVMIQMAAHAHEHLGQLIAYARTNGIAPPWSAPPPAQPAKKSGN